MCTQEDREHCLKSINPGIPETFQCFSCRSRLHVMYVIYVIYRYLLLNLDAVGVGRYLLGLLWPVVKMSVVFWAEELYRPLCYQTIRFLHQICSITPQYPICDFRCTRLKQKETSDVAAELYQKHFIIHYKKSAWNRRNSRLKWFYAVSLNCIYQLTVIANHRGYGTKGKGTKF